tara:strand:+ start:13420 stop:13527 length:108 start_codon:yes stop_codon:yes gene_type:complete
METDIMILMVKENSSDQPVFRLTASIQVDLLVIIS